MGARRDVFQAIADPTRRDILTLIAGGARNVNHIAEKFEISRQAISLHLKILEECSLIEVKKEGRERVCTARLESLNEVTLWVDQFKHHWESKIDSMEAYLAQLKQERKYQKDGK